MNTYPLIKTKWSNELVMTALFLVLILYHLPIWFDKPALILDFIILCIIGFALDAAANMIRYKRLWCCVSGGVTAAIISLLTQGVPLWGKIFGLAAALIAGKYIWGGTGKNRINPAMLGLLIILVIWDIPYPFFPDSYLLLPAIILSLPFLKSRPFAGLGYIAGATAVLFFQHDLNMVSLLTNGVFFWSCIVLTDPVTVTDNRIAGLLSGLIAGFLTMQVNQISLTFIAAILAANLFSYILDDFKPTTRRNSIKLRIPKTVIYDKNELLDLVEEYPFVDRPEEEIKKLSGEEIIRLIKDNDVYGMGGAAFPTYRKVKAVLTSQSPKKYLIINAVECDPGLVHDEYILRNLTSKIQKGIGLLNNCINFASIHLAAKDTDGLSFSNKINLHKVPERYPEGAEKILIKEVLGIRLDHQQIPAEDGILVLNIQTIYSIYKAVYQGCPADTKFLTVANLKDKSAKTVKVSLGMKLKDILDRTYPGTASCFVGGGMMQAYSANTEDTVEKNTNFIAVGAIPRYKESVQCSRCSNCIRNCPAGLEVNRIAELVEQRKLQETYKYKAADCIGCGSCSYSCLAGRNLSLKVRRAKEAILDEYH